MAICFSRPGRPVPWQRARTNNGQYFTAPLARAAMKELAWAARCAMKGAPLMTGPLKITVGFMYEIPKSWDRPKRNKALAGQIKPTGRPDIDNLGKLVLDAIKGVVFEDDAQLVTLAAGKHYGPSSITVVEIETAS